MAKRPYNTPTMSVFGSLRELTLDQKVTPMPSDNQSPEKGVGGKT
jgi:hypothetical protein